MLKVLAIDDEPEIVSFVTSWVSRRKHHADGETDAMRALHRVRQCSYDLVLVDLLMPKANGMSQPATNTSNAGPSQTANNAAVSITGCRQTTRT